ncbi:MAG: hypothetical protein MUE94_09665 [Verrucomicrobia bacterium]|jgi:hypothetical protein|nr:hypothetical protein [Verrucomicrobiota bacterium]
MTPAHSHETSYLERQRNPFQVFIAYEDLLTGLRSKAALTRVFNRLEWEVDPQVELCRFDMLRMPEVNDWAARQARQSDVVVVSTHGQGNLPEQVIEWIDLWAHEPGTQGSAIIASLDEQARPEAEDNDVLGRLRRVAAETGRTLFCHFGTTSRRVLEFAVRCIRQRGIPDSPDRDPAASPSHHSPPWGINE